MSASAGREPPPDVAMGPLNDAFKFFMANMPFNITPDVVRQHFSQFGPVNFVKVIYDKKTGQSRGYGFLYMLTAEGNGAVDAYAAAHNGRIELMGRPRVFLARHDQKRELPIRNPQLAGAAGTQGHGAAASYAPQQPAGVYGQASNQGAQPAASGAYGPASNQGMQHAASGAYGPASTQATSGYAPQQQQQQQPQSANGYAPAPATYAQPMTYAYQPQGQQQLPGEAAMAYAPATAAPVAYAPAPAAAQPGQDAAYSPAAAAPVAYGTAAHGYSSAPATHYANPHQPQAPQPATYASNQGAGTAYAPATQAAPPQAAGGSYSYAQPVEQQAATYAPQQATQPVSYGHHQQPQSQSYGHQQPRQGSYVPQQPGPTQPQPAAYQQHGAPSQPVGAQPAYAASQPVAQQGQRPPPPPPNRGNQTLSTKVFLENLPTDVTPKDVVQCLAKHSVTCTRCTMEYDKDQKATWCYAHVDLANVNNTSRVLDLAQRSALLYRGRILQASIDSLPPADGKAIPVGMGAPISTGPRPVSTHNGVRGSSNDPRNRVQRQQQQYGGGGRGGGGRRGGGRGGNNRNARRDRPY